MKGVICVVFMILPMFMWAYVEEITPDFATEEGIYAGGGGGFLIGGWLPSLDEVSSALFSAGYDSLPLWYMTTGGYGYGVLGKVIVGGEGMGFTQEFSTGDHRREVEAGFGAFDIGYIVVASKSVLVYPFLGIGGGSISIRLTEQSTPVDFHNVLADPDLEATLTTSVFLLSANLGMDWYLLFGDEEGGGGFILGIRGGYVFQPKEGQWTMGDIDVVNVPDVRLSGPYISFSIGMAGVAR